MLLANLSYNVGTQNRAFKVLRLITRTKKTSTVCTDSLQSDAVTGCKGEQVKQLGVVKDGVV